MRDLHEMATTYERVTGRRSFLHAYSPEDTKADTRYVFAYADTNFRGRPDLATEYMEGLIESVHAWETEAVYDAIMGNAELRAFANAVRALCSAHQMNDHEFGDMIVVTMLAAYRSYHPETGEFGTDCGRATINDLTDVMVAAGVEVGETDVPQLDDLVSAEHLGRMLRHTRDEDLTRKGMR